MDVATIGATVSAGDSYALNQAAFSAHAAMRLVVNRNHPRERSRRHTTNPGLLRAVTVGELSASAEALGPSLYIEKKRKTRVVFCMSHGKYHKPLISLCARQYNFPSVSDAQNNPQS